MWCRRPGSNRHGPFGPWDFKSQASAYSATPALVEDATRCWLIVKRKPEKSLQPSVFTVQLREIEMDG